MKNKLVLNVLLASLIILGTGITCSAQKDNDKAIAAADTSFFSVNNKEGWQMYNSYVSDVNADSVQLEVILQHDAKSNWQTGSYIGKVKGTGFKPQNTRLARFNLLDAVFEIKVNSDGGCYLRLVSGQIPAGNPVVIPVEIFYKK